MATYPMLGAPTLSNRTLYLTRGKISSGRAFFWFVVLTTAIAGAGRPSVLGFRLTGWMWMLAIGLSALCLLSPLRPQRLTFPILWFLPFILYMAWRTDFGDREDVQRLGIFLTPLFVGAAASSFPMTNLAELRKTYYFLLVAATVTYAVAAAQSGSRLAMTEWYIPAGACMTFTICAVAGIVDAGRGQRLGYAAVAIAALVCILSESRMPVLVIPLLFILGPTKLRIWKRVALGAIVIIGGLAFFYSGPVQENLFRAGKGSIADALSMDPHKLKTGGRLTAWPLYIEGMKDIWFGAGGTGSADFGNKTFGEGKWSHPHNEYIRLVFDYGIIGGLLFLIPLLTLFVLTCRRAYTTSDELQWAYFVSAVGLLAMFLLAVTGNVLMYVSYFGNMLFATIGISLAVYDLEKAKSKAVPGLAFTPGRRPW